MAPVPPALTGNPTNDQGASRRLPPTGGPADVEVPIEQVRRGLREFLDTGSRPSTVRQ
ncbi:Imm1 family immunity protein [Actinokineospora sp.]|uniref:Imm1 family immunity protein n=1 Tax=Actinokineospora sp. TaxID=1872133 RepID=UPI003D6B1B16